MMRENELAEINERAQEALVRRAALVDEADVLGRRVGSLMNLARTHYGQSRSASARAWGVAPATLQDLGAAASRAGVIAEPPAGDVAYVGVAEAVRRIIESDARVDRVVAGSMSSLYVTGADPLALARNGQVRRSELLLHLDDGSWIAVSSNEVTVGYRGAGPRNARQFLVRLGFSEELADRIAYDSTFIDVLPATGEERSPGEDELVTGPDPEVLSHHQLLVDRLGPAPWHHFDEDEDPLRDLDRWLRVFNHPGRPSWLDGPRRARVYLHEEAAHLDGYIPGSPFTMADGTVPTIVIEQGRMQLWLAPFPPADPSHHLSTEAYEALDLAGLYPRELSELDSAGKFLRWVRRGAPRPDFVDLGDGSVSTPNALEKA